MKRVTFMPGLRWRLAILLTAGALALPICSAQAQWRGGGWHGGGWHGGGWHGGGWNCCWRGGVFIGLPPVYAPPPAYYPPPYYYAPPYYPPASYPYGY
jgi:hypothetical protein